MRKLLYIALLVLSSAYAKAQDIHFSQAMYNSEWLNPALSGVFNGQQRFHYHHRHQWKAITIPYNTNSFAYNYKGAFGKPYTLSGFFSQDKSGDGALQQLQLLVGLARDFQLFSSKDRRVSLGLQLGYARKQINPDALNFGEQWNALGFFDPTLSNSENFLSDAYGQFQFNAGFLYYGSLLNSNNFQIGSSFYHINQAQQGFFEVKSKQQLRTNVHAKAAYALGSSSTLIPAVYYSYNDQQQELILGAEFDYLLQDRAGLYRSVFAGLYFRNSDALIAQLGMNYDSWTCGVSYDINLSSLKVASNQRGAFEVFLRYQLKRIEINTPKKMLCPRFL